VTEAYYKRTTRAQLEKKFRFTDWWGSRLYDARGIQIEWPNRPRIDNKIKVSGRTIQFYRREVAEKALTAKGRRRTLRHHQMNMDGRWNEPR
jgi:hypothetical protein